MASCEPSWRHENQSAHHEVAVKRRHSIVGHHAEATGQPLKPRRRPRFDHVKDAENKDTLGKKDIHFIYSDPEMVQEAIQSDFQRKLLVKKAGAFTVYVIFDGTGSNDLRFTFKE